MANIIAYPIGSSLYVNITNKCSNDCAFCVRTTTDFSMGYDLWLDKEPSVSEIVSDIKEKGVENYDELVFCGYGEPTERFDDMIEVIKRVKEFSDIKVRLNTNGHANLISGRDVTGELSGMVDIISVSLNAPDAARYQKICRSKYGEDAFYAMLDFARKARENAVEVVLSIVDIMDDEDKEKCRAIAKELGVKLRIRELIK